MSDRVAFRCNGESVEVDGANGASLLSVLREDLSLVGVKDGCAPQGQCGCCTVLVDGQARVACVTPLTRVAGREVTTPEGLTESERGALADSLVASGGSQCGFCTPGIVMRAAAAARNGTTLGDRGLAAHLCRCTGWLTVREAVAGASPTARDHESASRRATLEGGVQRVAPDVPLGGGGFADDAAPRDALVAVPLPSGVDVPSEEAAGGQWVVGASLDEARRRAGKVQGRRTTEEARPPLRPPPLPDGGVRVATSWVEPAYLEPDASWCEPGGEPATPLANGGAFGGKESSLAPAAARELADRYERTVRVVYSREDVVRLGPKRPPIAASARLRDGTVDIVGTVGGPIEPFTAPIEWPYGIDERGEWSRVVAPGPPTSLALRAVGLAERAVLVEGAMDEAGVDRRALLRDERAGAVLLDSCVGVASGALAGARVHVTDAGIGGVEIRVAAGDPLDEVVVRSYAIGAAHMALGWVCTEGIAIDDDGSPLDLTIRSFGIIRAAETPTIDVTIVDDPGAPRARSSDAVFAAVAAATWNAITRDEGARPEAFPARSTRIAGTLRR